MARTEARILSRVWSAADQADFRARTIGAQWLYWALLSQPELSMCGVLTEAYVRWSHLAADATPEDLEEWLAELYDHRFVVVDEATGEVWIRGFIRHDGVLRTPNFLVAMARSYEAVHSEAIRAGILDEVHREFGDDFDAAVLDRFPKGFPKGLAERIPAAFLSAARTPARGCPQPIAEGLTHGFPQPMAQPMTEGFHSPEVDSTTATHNPWSEGTTEPIAEPIAEGLTHAGARAHARPGTRPSTTSPSHHVTASSSSESGFTTGVPGPPDDEDPRLVDCWAALAKVDADAYIAKGNQIHSRRWFTAAADNRQAAHQTQARALLDQHPDWTGAQVAQAILDAKTPAARPEDGTQRAAMVAMTSTPCATCGTTNGMIWDDARQGAVPCPACQPEAHRLAGDAA